MHELSLNLDWNDVMKKVKGHNWVSYPLTKGDETNTNLFSLNPIYLNQIPFLSICIRSSHIQQQKPNHHLKLKSVKKLGDI